MGICGSRVLIGIFDGDGREDSLGGIVGDDILGYTGFRAQKISQLRDCKCVCSLPSKPRRAHARSAVVQHTFTYACPR